MSKCPKCESDKIQVTTDEEQLRSFYHCYNCGNEWSRAGINRKGDNTPKAKNPIIVPIICMLGIVLMIVPAFSGGESPEGTRNTSTETVVEETAEETAEGNILELNFSKVDGITVEVGKTESPGYLDVDVNSTSDFSTSDVVFVSDNPEVAIITFTEESFPTRLDFDIVGVGAGETDVYAITQDGSIKSEPIHVTVPEPIRIESIGIGDVKTELVIGETIHVEPTITPENVEDTFLKWTSSDEAVATVDNSGTVSAVGGGTATITATSSNDIEASFDVNVDGSKKLVDVNIKHKRDDDNNIGNEWSYDIEINGERTSNTMGIGVGDTIIFSAEITESDDNPDVGTASDSHTVTEDDLVNGFEVSMDVYVTENGGRNSGQSAHFIVTYTFAPK